MLIMQPKPSAAWCHRQSRSSRRGCALISTATPYQSFGLVHRLGDLPPGFHLFAAVDAWRPGVTLALHRNLGSLAYDQGGRRALRIVAGREWTRHIAGLPCSRTRQ